MDFARLRRRAPAIATAAFATLGVIGVAAFLFALRPCRFVIPPGTRLAYDLTVTTAELGEGGIRGAERVERRRVLLVGTGAEEVVQIVQVDGRTVDAALLRLASDGTARRQPPRPPPAPPAGVAIGLFDFNLMPLPPGSEQAWNAAIAWAALPADRAAVRAKVKRTRSGAAPEFRLTVPGAVEWVAADGRYRQVRDVAMAWRFNTVSGWPENARLTLTWGAEQAEGRPIRRTAYEAVLALAGTDRTDPAAARALAAGRR